MTLHRRKARPRLEKSKGHTLPERLRDLDLKGFKAYLVGGREVLPGCTEWEIFRYRREEWNADWSPAAGHTGSYIYSSIYRNKRDFVSFTGEAARDYLDFLAS